MLAAHIGLVKALAGSVRVSLQICCAQLADHDVQACQIAVLLAGQTDALEVLVDLIGTAHLLLKLGHLCIDLAILNGQALRLHLLFAHSHVGQLLLCQGRNVLAVRLTVGLVGHVRRGLLAVHRQHAVQTVLII